MRARSVPTMSTLSQRNFHQFITDKTIINTSHSQLVDAIEQLTESLYQKKEYFTQEYLRQIVNFIQKTLKNDLVVNDPGAIQLIEQLLSGCAKVNKSNTANFLLRPFERDDIVQAQNWYRISIYETILRECSDEQLMDGLHGRIRFYIHLLNSHQHPQWFIKTALRCVRRISELFSQNREMTQKVRIQRESYLSNIQNQLLGLKLLQQVRTMSHGIAGGLFAELLDGELVNQDQKYKLLQELQDTVQHANQRSSSAPVVSRLQNNRPNVSHIGALGSTGEPWHGPGARPKSTCPIKHAGIWTEVQQPWLAGVTADDAADTLSVKRNLGIQVPREARLTVSASKSYRKPQFVATPPRHLAYFTMADKFVGCSAHAIGTPIHKMNDNTSRGYTLDSTNLNTARENIFVPVKRAASLGSCGAVGLNYPSVGKSPLGNQPGDQMDDFYINDPNNTPKNRKPSVAERFGFGSSQIRRFVPVSSHLEVQQKQNESTDNEILQHTNNSGINSLFSSQNSTDEIKNEQDKLFQGSRRHSIETVESVDMESLSNDHQLQKNKTSTSSLIDNQVKRQQVCFGNAQFVGESDENGDIMTESRQTASQDQMKESKLLQSVRLDESSTSDRNWNMQEIQKLSNNISVVKVIQSSTGKVESEEKNINQITIQESPGQSEKNTNEQPSEVKSVQVLEEQAHEEVINVTNNKSSQVNQTSSSYTTSETLGTAVTWAPGLINNQESSQETSQSVNQREKQSESQTVPGTDQQSAYAELQRKTGLSEPGSAQSPNRSSAEKFLFSSGRTKPVTTSTQRRLFDSGALRSQSTGTRFQATLTANQARYLTNSYIFQPEKSRLLSTSNSDLKNQVPGVPLHRYQPESGVYDSGLRNTAFNGHLTMDYQKYGNCLLNSPLSPYRRAPSATGGSVNSIVRSPKSFVPPELSANERQFFEKAKRFSALRHSKLHSSKNRNGQLIVSEPKKPVICPGIGVSDLKIDQEIGKVDQNVEKSDKSDQNNNNGEKCKEFQPRSISRTSIPSRNVKYNSDYDSDEDSDDIVDQPGLLYIQQRNGTELPKEQVLDIKGTVEQMFTVNNGRELSFGSIDAFYKQLKRHKPFLNVFHEVQLRYVSNAIIQYIVEKDPDIASSYLWQAYLLGYRPTDFYFAMFNRLRIELKGGNEKGNSKSCNPTQEKLRLLYMQWRGHREAGEEPTEDADGEEEPEADPKTNSAAQTKQTTQK